jgi:hypothetical protein
MQDISKRANHELSEISLVATKPPQTTTSLTNKSSTNTTLTSTSNKNEKAYCNEYGYRHWPYSKWCKQCKQHKSDKWNWCLTCNKHYGKEYLRCKAAKNKTLKASTGALNTTNGLLTGSTRLSQMAINTAMFKTHVITRDLVLLDTACFNHLFNSKKWFIKYKDINPVAVRASNGGQGAAIGKGIVRLVMLLLNGSEHILELPNTMY